MTGLDRMSILLLDFFLAFRNSVRHARRTAIAVGAVAFGVAALIVASGFVEWMLLTFREEAIQSRLGHLQVVRPGYHNGGSADPYSFLLPDLLPESTGLLDSRSVRVIAPRLSFNGLISHEDATLSFIGEGVSPSHEAAFEHGVQILQGRDLSSDEARDVIVGVGLARNLGLSIGHRVVLLATPVTGGTNAVELSVRGIFSTISKAYDDVALRVPIQTAQELLRTTGAHAWVVLLQETRDTEAVLARLREKLAQQQFEVVPWYELADLYNKTVRLFSAQVNVIRLILAVIILLGILNTTTMSIMERTGEIGTCMALGVRRRGILRLFIAEGLVIGCMGGILGICLGLALAVAISAAGIPMPPPPGVSHGYTTQVVVTLRIVVEALVLAMLSALLGSIYPAWSASRKKVVDALRHNR
jgi:putative ABC transport system permease protein